MDRILSARINDSVYRRITHLSSKLHTSKKSIIEKAVDLLEKEYEKEQGKGTDIFDETCGIWQRNKSPAQTVSDIRTAFNQSAKRRVS